MLCFSSEMFPEDYQFTSLVPACDAFGRWWNFLTQPPERRKKWDHQGGDLEGFRETFTFLSLFACWLPSGYQFPLPWVPVMIYSLAICLKATGPRNHKLKSLNLWVNINVSSFKLVIPDNLSECKSSTVLK